MSLFDAVFPWLAHRRCEREAPATAARLGLSFEPGQRRDEIGEMAGTFHRRIVLVRLDQPGLEVHYQRAIESLDCSTWEDASLRRPTRNFDSGNAQFDRLFPRRNVPVALQSRLRTDASIVDRLVGFHRTWRHLIVQMDFSRAALRIVLKKRGWDDCAFIPMPVLEPLLSASVDVVCLLDTPSG